MSIITKYSGPSKFYFYKLLEEMINIGNLQETNKNILDYGCGNKILSKILYNKNVLNYDINPLYSDYKNIDNLEFDIVIMNHVLMYLEVNEIINLFNKINSISPYCNYIIGIGKQNFVSKIAKFIALEFKAHKYTKTTYKEQLNIINKNLNIIKYKKNIYYMTDIYLTTNKAI